MTAPKTQRFWPRKFEKGTRVIAQSRYRGVIDGMAENGNYIVAFDHPVMFPTLGIKIERGCFCASVLEELR